MYIRTDVQEIVGFDAVRDDNETLLNYSSDQSFVEPRKPEAVVFASSVEHVQEVVKYANSKLTPVIPFSSGLNFHGATIPKVGGIVLDLSRMNKIIAVDENNWSAVIEPGVTARQLQDELAKHQLRAMLPFGIHPDRSALTSFAERDPAVAAASFEFGNELILDTEFVLPTGEIFRTGLWCSGGKPGSPMGPVRAMISRLWTGGQGTLGVFTKMNIKVEYLPALRKIFIFQFDTLPAALESLKAIQHREIGHECFIINSFNLAALLCKDWQVPEKFPADKLDSKDFDSLRSKLPAWVLVVCSNGSPRMPEGKIAYEEEALQKVAAENRMQPYKDARAEKILLEEMLKPWGILRKFCYKGSVHDVSFKAQLKQVPEFQKLLMEVIDTYKYPAQDVGMYLLPVERGRAIHCEFDLHCDHADKNEAERVKALWLELSQMLIDEGAFFDRPYGAWAEMVYGRAGTYTQKLKELKKELDPNNILNPGKLCF